MTDDTRSVIERHWSTANDRDWDAFAALLEPDLLYEVPQTRERIRGADGYLDFFRTWPGDWRVRILRLVCEPGAAACLIDFTDGGGTMTGMSFFRLSARTRIAQVTDYWPEPYEPPPRASRFVERI